MHKIHTNITSFSSNNLLIGLLLAVSVLLAYHPAWNGKLIWDDEQHIVKPELQSVAGLVHIWTKLGATQQYYPLVHSVFWLEHRIWGYATPGYHLLNILLHIFSAFLLLKILKRLAIPGAWFAAFVFALHPIQVESVAWISELKNTLSGVFFFGSVLAYLSFDAGRKKRFYWTALALFIAGQLSNTAIAPLPVLLLIVFWWKRGTLSLKRDVVPLFPFFLAGIASGLFTAWVERTYIISDAGNEFRFSLVERCLIAGRSFWFYLGKLAWPAHLIFIYPRWQISQAVWWQYLFPLTALVFCALLWLYRGKSRAPLAAFLCFAAALFPALGFFNVYPFRFSFVADHFQYLACIGPIALASAAAARGLKRFGGILVPAVIGGALVALMGFLSWRQCGIYADAEVLYKSIIAGNPACWMAWYNLGNDASEKNDFDRAIGCFRKSLAIKPDYIPTYVKIGDALMQQGRIEEGIDFYRQAIKIDSVHIPAYINLGSALMRAGKADEAMAVFKKATVHAPAFAPAWFNLGTALIQTGHLAEGIDCYNRAVELDSGYSVAHVNLGWALLQEGRTAEAEIHLREALRSDPGMGEAHANLGQVLVQTGRFGEAIPHLQAALRAHPDDFKSISALRDAYIKTGQLEEAIRVVENARAAAISGGQDSLAKGIENDLQKLNASRNSGLPHPVGR